MSELPKWPEPKGRKKPRRGPAPLREIDIGPRNANTYIVERILRNPCRFLQHLSWAIDAAGSAQLYDLRDLVVRHSRHPFPSVRAAAMKTLMRHWTSLAHLPLALAALRQEDSKIVITATVEGLSMYLRLQKRHQNEIAHALTELYYQIDDTQLRRQIETTTKIAIQMGGTGVIWQTLDAQNTDTVKNARKLTP